MTAQRGMLKLPCFMVCLHGLDVLLFSCSILFWRFYFWSFGERQWLRGLIWSDRCFYRNFVTQVRARSFEEPSEQLVVELSKRVEDSGGFSCFLFLWHRQDTKERHVFSISLCGSLFLEPLFARVGTSTICSFVYMGARYSCLRA